MFVCVDANLVGENDSDHEPSLLSVAWPRSVPEFTSPLIHTSTESMPAPPVTGSTAVPWMVKVELPVAFTFSPSVGAVIVMTGPAPAALAGAAAAAPAAGAVEAVLPPPVTLTVLNHQPLP